MERILSTVSTIFKERYGAHLKIERKSGNKDHKPQFKSHWQNAFVYSRTLRQVSFPIFNSKRQLQAIATASPVENQDAIIFDEMAQFLQLTIAEHIELTEVEEIQRQAELAFEKAHSESSKIVELKTRSQKTPQTIEFKKPNLNFEFDFQPLWISGTNHNFNSHIAFSVHDWVANWAFINAKEIPDLVWEDPHAWQSFPQVTLFIPEIEKLNKKQIATLEFNLKNIRKLKQQKPLVIVTSNSEVSAELEELKKYFKFYKSNTNVTARVQAHFLLFHHKDHAKWLHECEKSKSLYFLPFSPGPTQLH